MLSNYLLESLLQFEIQETLEWDFLKYREERPFGPNTADIL